MKYKVYLFDFDGTLFDTLESSKYVFSEAYKDIGFQIDLNEVLRYTREPVPDSYLRNIGSMDGYKFFIDRLHEYLHSQKVIELTTIYGDTIDCLKRIKNSGGQIGIVTSNSREHVIDVLKKYGLENMFDVIVGHKEAPIPKPNPGPILKAIELLKYVGNASDIVYIGDAINDVIAAKKAGVTPLLIDRLHEFDNTNEKIYSLEEIM